MAPSRQGQTWLHRLLSIFSLCLPLVFPAAAWADLYGWVDDRGVHNIVDSPALIPERFRGQVRRVTVSKALNAPQTSPLPNADPPSVREVEPTPAPHTQGSVAVALAERLALAHRPTPLQAANALLERGILPPASWMLDEPIDPWWMADLARSLLAASTTGRILQTPETAFQTLEGVAAERGIALVTVEPPLPPEPPVIVTQPVALIVETVLVPAFPLHHGSLFHHPHFRKKSFKDHPHLKHRFPKDHGQHHHHPLTLHPRQTAGRKIAGFPHVESHSVQSGSTRLTAGGSTVLTTGGREKRSGATRCASSSMGHSVRICP